jgi:hypothetical protein
VSYGTDEDAILIFAPHIETTDTLSWRSKPKCKKTQVDVS